MNTPPLVQIRKPDRKDVETRISLGVSREIVRMYGGVSGGMSRMPRERATRWFERLNAHPCAWVIEVDEQLAGEIRLDDINTADRRARLAVGLFSESQLGRGIGRQAIDLALAHAFGELGLHRVDLRVLAYNQRAIRCYEACGFTREGVERESALVGGEWHDDWIMAILEHEFHARMTAGDAG